MTSDGDYLDWDELNYLSNCIERELGYISDDYMEED